MRNITETLKWFNTNFIVESWKRKWFDYMLSIIIEEIIRKQNITTEVLWNMILDINDLVIKSKFEAYLKMMKSYESKIIESLFSDKQFVDENVWYIDFYVNKISLKTKNLLWNIWNYLPQEWILLSKLNNILSNKSEKKNKYRLTINLWINKSWKKFIKNIYLQLI